MKAPALLAFVATLFVLVGLTWPLAVRLGAEHHTSAFGASHAWFGLHLHEVLRGARALSPTDALGFPRLREARFIGWAPALLGQPLQPLLGPLATHQLLELLALPLSAAATVPLLRRWTGADRLALVAGAVVYATCPYLLATLQMGEMPKLHAWCLPLFLWSFDRALDGRGRPTLALIALATSFTSPYHGLALPLLAPAVALRAPRAAPLPLALVALSLLPALGYYTTAPAAVQDALFQPAHSPPIAELASPHRVATLQDLLLAGPVERGRFEALHVAYLGLPTLLLASVLARGRRGRGPGLALLLAGALLAAGPQLATDGGLTPIPLPARLLELVGYPYARGGLWFRLVLVASLGLGLLVAAAVDRRPRWALALVLVHLVDAARVSGPWPLALEPVPAKAQLATITGGAVLQLPLQEGPSLAAGQRGLLHALSHRRPTTSLPRDVGPGEASANDALRRALSDADRLRALGFSAVVLDRTLPADTSVYASLRRLEAEVVDEAGLRIWLLR